MINNFKTNLLSVVTLALLLFFSVTPVYAATEKHSYSFLMEHEVVDGSSNGEFFSLDSGSYAYIAGNTMIEDSEYGYDSNKVYYKLYRSKSGSDKSYGQISTTVEESFSTKFPTKIDTTADTYYLYIYKVADDYNDISGWGTISQ